MLTRRRPGWFIAALVGAIAVADTAAQQAGSDSTRAVPEKMSEIVVHSFEGGLGGVRAANADVKLRVDRDSAQGAEPLLVVDYPAPGPNPASRDVRCEAVNRVWTRGRAIAFRIKPSHAVRLSVSFQDRNHVAYTTWVDLKGNEWQPVRLPFADMRPNPYFQPPDARTGSAIDVSDVAAILFAPHDETPGQLALSRFVVVE